MAGHIVLWWFWILLGFGLLIFEAAVSTGLFALFFGLSALAVGGVAALGVLPEAWMEWALFSCFSVVALVALRGPLKGRLNIDGLDKPIDELVGQAATVTQEIPAGGIGKVELRGAGWNARLPTGTLARGARCVVERVEGLTLWVRPE